MSSFPGRQRGGAAIGQGAACHITGLEDATGGAPTALTCTALRAGIARAHATGALVTVAAHAWMGAVEGDGLAKAGAAQPESVAHAAPARRRLRCAALGKGLTAIHEIAGARLVQPCGVAGKRVHLRALLVHEPAGRIGGQYAPGAEIGQELAAALHPLLLGAQAERCTIERDGQGTALVVRGAEARVLPCTLTAGIEVATLALRARCRGAREEEDDERRTPCLVSSHTRTEGPMGPSML